MKKTSVSDNDNLELINKKMLIRMLFETGLRVSELLKIISFNRKTLLLKGKGNKIRQVFHNYETTIKISNLKITTKTIRI
jgi:integrase/recombinase XerD